MGGDFILPKKPQEFGCMLNIDYGPLGVCVESKSSFRGFCVNKNSIVSLPLVERGGHHEMVRLKNATATTIVVTFKFAWKDLQVIKVFAWR
jgi:hypothetical protein